MTQSQLNACGKLIAACEVHNKDITPIIANKMVNNPLQLLPYWFTQTIRHFALNGDDVTGQTLADLYNEVGDLTPITPVEAGKVHAAYIKAKMQPQIVNARVEYGNRLREARKAAGLTLMELAEKSGIRYQHIHRIEQGKYNVTLDIMTRLALTLGVDL